MPVTSRGPPGAFLAPITIHCRAQNSGHRPLNLDFLTFDPSLVINDLDPHLTPRKQQGSRQEMYSDLCFNARDCQPEQPRLDGTDFIHIAERRSDQYGSNREGNT